MASGKHDRDLGEWETLADSYLRYHAEKRKEDNWAYDELDDMVRQNPHDALEVTLILLRKAGDDDSLLAYIAAGPLEDLLRLRGPEIIDRLEREGKKNSRIQLALSGVWGLHGLPVFDRWYALMKQWGFATGQRRAL